MIQIQDINVKQGEKKWGFLPVKGGSSVPFTVICGKEEGKTLLVTAGIHGAEYPGIAAVVESSRELRPEELRGNVILIHAANPTGFLQRMPALVPEDGKNLNRMFPGSPGGTVSERIAWQITKLQLQSDFYLDLHSGDLHEDLVPYVYFPTNCDREVSRRSYEMAVKLDVPYMVESSAVTGAYNSAAKQGDPSLLIERGGKGLWSGEEVNTFKLDIRRVMLALGMTETNNGIGCQDIHNSLTEALLVDQETACSGSEKDVVFKDAHYLQADRDGLWYPSVKPGDPVKAGTFLGEIRDFFGTAVAQFSAKADGVVLYQLSSLAVKTGDVTVAYGCLK